jgi:hypothetical protein
MKVKDLLPRPELRLAFAGFLTLGVALLVAPRAWSPAWFFPRLTGAGAFGYALLLLLPRAVYATEDRPAPRDASRARRALTGVQLALAASSLLALGGSLGLFRLHRVGIPYDKLMHLAVPMLMTIVLSRFIRRWYTVRIRTSLASAAAIVGVTMIAWELTEYASDALFGTSAFGVEGRHVALDTTLDLGLGVVGMALGAALVKDWRWRPA